MHPTHDAPAQLDPSTLPAVEKGRGWQDVPVSVTQRVLTHPTLSIAARGLYAVVSALREDPEGAQAVLDATPKDLLHSLVAELAEAGYAWRNSSGGWTVGDLGPEGESSITPDRPEWDEPPTTPNRPEVSQSGWAYAIADSDRRLVKIGTSVDVSRRLRSMQTSSPRELEILWQAEGGAALEAHLHESFAARRVRGEWFDFSNVDAVSLISAAARSFGQARGAR